ncbi:MAG: translation initiation factor [Crocinitomix sp. MedPE-SWsnd]|nr:MAG: translation initiation factor [Crocinitomix sp. MedPE-SWsnd]
MGKNKKKRIDVVYSTNPDFDFDHEGDAADETLPNDEQYLNVMIDRKKRKGKEVVLITGFIGTDDDLKDLGKTLKQKCGVGGSAKDGEIMVQGNQRDKIMDYLKSEGYNVKRVGG